MEFKKFTEVSDNSDNVIYVDISYLVSFGEIGDATANEHECTRIWLSYPKNYMCVIVRESLEHIVGMLNERTPGDGWIGID